MREALALHESPATSYDAGRSVSNTVGTRDSTLSKKLLRWQLQSPHRARSSSFCGGRSNSGGVLSALSPPLQCF